MQARSAGRSRADTGECTRSRISSARDSRRIRWQPRCPSRQCIHVRRDFGVAHGCRALLGDPDHIATRTKAVTFPPEYLAYEASYAVSHDRGADLAGHRHPKPRRRRPGRLGFAGRCCRHKHKKVAQVVFDPCALDLQELPALPQPDRRGEPLPFHLPPTETLRRLRPRRRRAAITARPPRVAIRARYPWVRARLKLWGWYVRFIGVSVDRRRKADHYTGQQPKHWSNGTKTPRPTRARSIPAPRIPVNATVYMTPLKRCDRPRASPVVGTPTGCS